MILRLADQAGALLLLAESLLDQLDETVSGFDFVNTLRHDDQFGATGCSQHHDTHDAFTVDVLAILRHIDVTRKRRGRRDEAGSCPGVQAEFVDDDDGPLLHVRMSVRGW
mgnify:CR=1 FL=1